MIDWHSHVLPNMDDGSESVDESLAMLRTLQSEGIKRVIATPHFMASRESVESFLSRRKRTKDALDTRLDKTLPEVLCGAEVKYYTGISNLPDLETLTVENTNLLLLEMPYESWTGYTLGELFVLAGMSEFKIMLAHIDRYLGLQKREVIDKLSDAGILFQANASFFTGFFNRREAIKLLCNGKLHFIGSDSHNMTSRPPKIRHAYDTIQRKLGQDFLTSMNKYGYNCFDK